jgi:hypothetical protein
MKRIKAKTTCRVEGCNNPRHVYPKSGTAIYCDEHLHLKSKCRKGEDVITGPMRDVLHYLLEAKRAGFPFQALGYPLVRNRTLYSLFDRDWINSSKGIDDQTKYAITTRGEEKLVYYETMINRPDGICPKCGVAERHIRSSGQHDAYCIDCLRLRGEAKRARGADIGNIHRPCSRCHKRNRHRYPNGKYSTYCKHCEKVNRRRNARKDRKRLLESVRAGGPVPSCQLCKVHPRMVHPNSISKYCAVCKPTYERKMKLKRRLQALLPYQWK